nr:hypothetical protein [Bacillus licheniformis]
MKKTQKEAPKLTKTQYDELMLPQHADEMTFSSTHLKYVNHGNDAEYAIKARERLGYKPLSPHSKSDPFENVKTNKDQKQSEDQDSH